MLKVAPGVVVRSYGRTSKFFRLDGLLLFCIIMGLRSASSAVIPIIIVLFFLSIFPWSVWKRTFVEKIRNQVYLGKLLLAKL